MYRSHVIALPKATQLPLASLVRGGWVWGEQEMDDHVIVSSLYEIVLIYEHNVLTIPSQFKHNSITQIITHKWALNG